MVGTQKHPDDTNDSSDTSVQVLLKKNYQDKLKD